MTEPRCFKIDASDNVATLLADAAPGPLIVVGESGLQITTLEPINLGHKVALHDIAQGESIIKFGIPIGHASKNIRTGQWVHLHNCASGFDDRSQTLDIHSGAATDTKYE